MSKMSFITENGCGLECVPKRPQARRLWSKLYFISSDNWSIGRLLFRKGHKTVPVMDSHRFAWVTSANAQEIREAAVSAGAFHLEIWRPGKSL